MDNPHPEPETDGVNVALERIRALESRIRQAIQMNNRDLDRPVDVVDRERSALDSVEIQLELVEDKLRELRLLTLDPREYDDRTVTMSQLDRVRQELLATARSELRCVTFGQEIVREVIAFADVHEGTTPRGDPLVSSSEASPHLQLPDLSPEGEAWTLKSADWRTPPKSAPAQEPGAAQQPLHAPAALQDPYGWDAFKEAPSQAAARRGSLDRWDHPRPYTEDAVDRMLSTSGARGAGREQRAKTGSAVSKELFSPTAMMDDDSYVQADSSSRYQHDPQFGGKISLSGYQGAKSDSPSSPQPLPPMPPDHPRVRELIGSEAVARAGQEEQTPSSAASAQSWCVGPAVPRSRYVDPPTPLREPEQAAAPPRSPGALDGFRRGVARTLAAAPQCIMAGAIVAAGAAGFLKATEGVVLGKPEQAKPRVRSRAKENCPAPPFYNTSPTGTPPRGRLYPDLPPEMPTCRG